MILREVSERRHIGGKKKARRRRLRAETMTPFQNDAI